MEDLEDLSEDEQPKLPRSHVTGDADFASESIYHPTSQDSLAVTRSQQQLSQENLLEAEKEVAKPYAHKLLESERLSPYIDHESQPDSFFNHGFVMFPLDKLAKLSPSLAKDLRSFFDQF